MTTDRDAFGADPDSEEPNGYQLRKGHDDRASSFEVERVRIAPEQVTPAMFEQLDEELIFLADGTLRGVPWGRVNDAAKNSLSDVAFYVIWQDGNSLKRSPVPSLQIKDWKAWLFDRETTTGLAWPHYCDEAQARFWEQVAILWDLDLLFTVSSLRL
jgi:hypothetical protein